MHHLIVIMIDHLDIAIVNELIIQIVVVLVKLCTSTPSCV
jgi:hypothetical protein